MMQSMDVMATTTTATDCVWSFPGAAGAQEAVSVGSVELPEADMGLRPDAPSTGSLCRVSMQTSHLFAYCTVGSLLYKPSPLHCCVKDGFSECDLRVNAQNKV